jgi:Domain of unknown function (DUF4124)
MKIIFLMVATAFFSFSANADIYKWVDANGNVHYSNTPPPEVKGTKVKVDDPAPPATPISPTLEAAYWKQKDDEFRQRRDEKSKGENEAADKIALEKAEKRKRACNFYDKDLEKVTTSWKHVAVTPEGDIVESQNPRRLNKGERAAAIGQLSDLIAKDCK